jgi:hypothetical protein
MSTFQVLRAGYVMKSSSDQLEAQQEYEALVKRHPHRPIQLVKVDVIQATPAQQAFNQINRNIR